MQTFIALLKPFLFIVAQRDGPDVLPRSQFLLGLVIALHVAVYYLGLLALDTAPARTVSMPLLDTVTQSAFFSLLMLGMGFRARLVQTLTAVFGADVLLNLVALPLAMIPVSDPAGTTWPVIASIVVLLWSISVKAHILHRAAGLPYFVGVVISVGFFIAFLLINDVFFGMPA